MSGEASDGNGTVEFIIRCIVLANTESSVSLAAAAAAAAVAEGAMISSGINWLLAVTDSTDGTDFRSAADGAAEGVAKRKSSSNQPYGTAAPPPAAVAAAVAAADASVFAFRRFGVSAVAPAAAVAAAEGVITGVDSSTRQRNRMWRRHNSTVARRNCDSLIGSECGGVTNRITRYGVSALPLCKRTFVLCETTSKPSNGR